MFIHAFIVTVVYDYDDKDQSWKKDLLAWKDLLAKPHEWWDIRLKEVPILYGLPLVFYKWGCSFYL